MKRIFQATLVSAAGFAGLLFPALAPAQATSAAESACLAEVNSRYRGGADRLRVIHSEFSQANSLLIIEADRGERWRCLSSNDGYVAELSREGGSHGSGGHGGSHGRGVTIYEDYGFRGRSETLTENNANLKYSDIGNDSLSSIRVPDGCRVTLYEDNNYRGRRVELYDDVAEIDRAGLRNDSASSIEVDCRGGGDRYGGGYGDSRERRGVTIYQDYGYAGRSETLYEDNANLKYSGIGNDSLSSIRVPGGCRVTLYEDNNYRGRSIELYDDEPEINRAGLRNDSASSIRIDCR